MYSNSWSACFYHRNVTHSKFVQCLMPGESKVIILYYIEYLMQFNLRDAILLYEVKNLFLLTLILWALLYHAVSTASHSQCEDLLKCLCWIWMKHPLTTRLEVRCLMYVRRVPEQRQEPVHGADLPDVSLSLSCSSCGAVTESCTNTICWFINKIDKNWQLNLPPLCRVASPWHITVMGERVLLSGRL